MTEIIKLNHVNYSVNNSKILDDINLTINKGDFLTFSGPSGSGKSTIMRLIANMISPNSGEILYQNKDINDYEPTEYRREVSYCFQQPTLFGETVKDNLEFPFKVRNKKIDNELLIQKLEMANLNKNFINQKVIDLSGGQRQRIALLRNLMFLPSVLILDEVTTGLDKDNKEIIHNLVTDLNKNHDVTVLAITHDQSELNDSKSIVNIESGKIVEGK
ncbi:ABC transporter ATP-binding protein [Companilactobacillus sp. DQM5]|uniref:ABC transporter ATP-binding protein n=1 Tax=Companilactobacillus sp. DQM5 TaxID=3463359 RepID=UPI004058D03C